MAQGRGATASRPATLPFAMHRRLAISIGQYSTAGTKPANQDFFGALVPDDGQLLTKGIAVAIADGISTSALGAVAAETAVKSFLTDYYCTSDAWSVRTSAQRVMAATNSWMHAQNRRNAGGPVSDAERERGLICTLTAVVLKSRTAHVFHVGDGCVLHLSGGVTDQMTEPHRIHLGGGESYLARAMGMDRHVEIDWRQAAIQAGDRFVLMTDGVADLLPRQRIADLAMGDDVDHAARAIADAALAAGSDDNLTVQVLRVDEVPDGAVDDLLVPDGQLPPAPDLAPGAWVGGYALVRELHAGARSYVWLARDPADGRKVIVKALATGQADNPANLRALLLEEWIARRIDNPQVMKAAPRHDGAPALACAVFERVPGQTLDQWLADGARPDLAIVRDVVRQIAAGLQALHRREILHRDLGPHNVMLDGDGTVTLIDFGSAQVAGLDDLAARDGEDAMFAGRLQYGAPELFLGAPASRRSDLFSLGVVTYQMLTGHLPYGPRLSAAGSRAQQRRLRYVPITELNPDVPDWVDAAIARAVKIDPAARYSELSEFVFDLSHPNSALTAPDPRPWIHRRAERVWQAISAILLLALLAVLARGM